MNRASTLLCGLLILINAAMPGVAQTKGVATFGGLKNLEFIKDFYNGGTGSLGSGPGKDFPLQFTGNAQAIVSAAKRGSGNFSNNPGGYPVMFFQTGTNVVVNAPNGISVSTWFYYSTLQPATATIFAGQNATGNILASITLTPNNTGCTGYKLCVWSPAGMALTAAAGSIRFAGTANNLAIGTIHMGQKMPSTITLTSSLNPSELGQPVTITATLLSTAGAIPSGTVTFKSANQILGQVPTVQGVASISVSTLPLGSSTISATFKSDNFVTTSAKLIQTVNP